MKKIAIVLVVVLGLFIRLYNLPEHYSFDWDQEDDAAKVMEMITAHKPRLIGPRVANDNGFFVAPWHYYFLTPFYLVTQGHPLAGAYAAIFVWLIVCLLIFGIGSKIFNFPVAFATASLSALNPALTSWNAMHGPVFSLLIFYLCHQFILRPTHTAFIKICLVTGLAATTHLVPASLIIPVLATVLISRYRPPFKFLILGLISFSVFLLPLIFFDLRHQFLNFQKILEFVRGSNPDNQSIFLRTFWRSLNVFGSPFIAVERIISILVLIISPFLFTKKNHRLLIIIWILTPLIVLSLYHGNIPEYYYGMVSILIPIFAFAILNRLHQFLFIPLILLLFFYRLSTLNSQTPFISLATKDQIIKFFATNISPKPFFISFDLPLGMHTGYNYLIDYYHLHPDPAAPLYTVHLSDQKISGTTVFQSGNLSITKR